MNKLLYIIVFLNTVIPAFGQLKPEEAIQKLYTTYPQEKVVLNLSKGEYLAGETIYYKAYVLTGYEASDISTNVYVELYDRNKKIVAREMVPVYKGTAEGALPIPASVAEDEYTLRSYTQWMLNFPEQLNGFNQVKIYNPYSSNKLVPKPVDWTAEVYPESGTLLNDVSSLTAIRLNSKGTLPASWKGELLENGKLVENAIVVYNNQVGRIQFLPQFAHNYSLKITDNNGITKEVNLPAVKQDGIVLQIRQQVEKIAYRIFFKNVDSNGRGYKLIATINDQNVFTALVKKSHGIVDGSFSTKELPVGVLNFSLFDVNDRLVASRLMFLDAELSKVKKPVLNLDSLSFAPRAVNKWKLQQDTLSWYTYAVQVQDGTFPSPANFLAAVYLNSDFPGAINNPDWYFNENNPTRADALDALLLSEQWKRFNWADLTAGRFPHLQYLPDKYLSYKATVIKGKKVMPLKEVNLLIKTKDSKSMLVQANADSSGNFYLDNVFFIDTIQVFYQLNSKKLSAKDISINFELLNQFHPLKMALPAFQYQLEPRKKNDSLPVYIARAVEQKNELRILDEKYKMMESVVIRTRARSATQKLDEELSSGLFQTMNETVFDFINNDQTSAMGYRNILQWLEGRVPGFTTSTGDGGEIIPYIRRAQATLFLDEMQVDPDMINTISTSDIAMIKVLRGPFVGARGGGDAIAIYTRRGGMHSVNDAPNLPSNYLVGYKKIPHFFTPDYSSDVYKNFSDKRDILFLQETIYPTIDFDKALIQFNNTDVTKSYRIIVTGLTNTGAPVYLNKVMDSKRP